MLRRGGHEPDAVELAELRRKVEASYAEQMDIRYAAARLWVDQMVESVQTRHLLSHAVEIVTRYDNPRPFQTGVLQV